MNIERLIQQFEQFDTKSLDEYKELISSKYNDEIFPPFIPHIGNSYRKYKIMMYGMAQSISEPWPSLINKNRTEKIRQMYDAPTYDNIWIAPYKVMLSLAGMYIYAKYRDSIETLDKIHDCIAATNYYKFSLSLPGNDINPDKGLSKHLSPDDYWEANDKLSLSELDMLDPSIVISFNGRHNNIIKNAGYVLLKINDPAWIKRGGGPGTLKEAGSWYRNIKNPIANELAEAYLNQIDETYSGKKPYLRTYLLKYYDDWEC